MLFGRWGNHRSELSFVLLVKINVSLLWKSQRFRVMTGIMRLRWSLAILLFSDIIYTIHRCMYSTIFTKYLYRYWWTERKNEVRLAELFSFPGAWPSCLGIQLDQLKSSRVSIYWTSISRSIYTLHMRILTRSSLLKVSFNYIVRRNMSPGWMLRQEDDPSADMNELPDKSRTREELFLL